MWATPGGGIDPGETPSRDRARARRGGRAVGSRDRAVDLDARARVPVLGRELGRAGRALRLRPGACFEPQPRFTPEQLAAEFVTGMRWWTQEELASSDELFAPSRLPELVAALLRDGPPGEPSTSASSASRSRRTARARRPSRGCSPCTHAASRTRSHAAVLELHARSRPLRREAHLDLGAGGLADQPLQREADAAAPSSRSCAQSCCAVVGHLVEQAADPGARRRRP